MKKGKKMPSIEIEGESEAEFELRDGKIVRVGEEHQGPEHQGPEHHTQPPHEGMMPGGPGRD